MDDGMVQRREQVFVQAFLAHPSIEAFHQAVLHWLAGRDVMPTNLAVFLPLQPRVAGQLGTVVADLHAWIKAAMYIFPQSDGKTAPKRRPGAGRAAFGLVSLLGR